MKPQSEALFNSDLWSQALEKYARETRLSVELFDVGGSVVLGPIHSTPLFQLFEDSGCAPGIFAECARRCLAQNNGRPAVLVSEFYGLTVVGTSFVLEGKVVGAAVSGYAFADFAQISEIQRLAKDTGIRFARLWGVAREQRPVPKRRLAENGELLQVLGDALLRENYRTRQFQQAAFDLQETAREREEAHRQLQRTEVVLRKKEQETRWAREFAESVLRTSPVPLLVLEKDLRVNMANNAFYEIFRVAPAETEGRLIYHLGNGQWNIPKLRELLEDILPHRHLFRGFEVTHGFETIGERTMLLNARRMEQEADEPERIVLVIEDITEKRKLLEQQERLYKVEKMAAAGQLAAAMAHEINNPLSSVTNALYLLQKHANLDESARVFATTAATELARVSRIVKQSLSYYRVGSTPVDLDLGKIVNESLQIFREKIQKAGVELKPKVATGSVLVGFPDELRQVIDNLLLNALEAMPSGGCLSISVHLSFDWKRRANQRSGVRLTIADTGYGIPKQLRLKVFEPFFTTKAEKGTGLGLWILQGIIAKHDGVMSLRSSDAKGKSGTVISIFLPAHSRGLRKSKPSKTESAA